jgi:protease I
MAFEIGNSRMVVPRAQPPSSIRMWLSANDHFRFGMVPWSEVGGRTVKGSCRSRSAFRGPTMSAPSPSLTGSAADMLSSPVSVRSNVRRVTDVPKSPASQRLIAPPYKLAGRLEPERCTRRSIICPGETGRIRKMDLNGKEIAILATNGFEQAELEVPRDRLKKAGATVEVVSLAAGEIKGWDKKDWGRPVQVDKILDEVSAGDYDVIVLPGGQINPDLLRVEPKALKFIKDIFDAKKVVAAVCHAPWLLIETDIAKGRRMTSFKSIKIDVANAGAKWEDFEVVDQGVITSRNPGDLEAFSAKIIEEVKEGRHTQRSAA